MADVYRQSLMSLDTIFGGRGRGNGYRIVLSERHKILRRCLEKAGGRRLFGVEERVTGDSGESEAEEVRVCYGEEDEEEIEGSQCIGEPWDWDEPQEVESEEMKRDESRFKSEDEIVSPTLMVSRMYCCCCCCCLLFSTTVGCCGAPSNPSLLQPGGGGLGER